MTVLFADLKGSMELLGDRDPEDARALLDAVLTRMMEAVHRYEGTVNQVMGDGIMALFGAPLALEDHALRACYAALAIQNSMQAMPKKPFERTASKSKPGWASTRAKSWSEPSAQTSRWITPLLAIPPTWLHGWSR